MWVRRRCLNVRGGFELDRVGGRSLRAVENSNGHAVAPDGPSGVRRGDRCWGGFEKDRAGLFSRKGDPPGLWPDGE